VQGERSIHTSVRSEAGVAAPFHPVVTTEPQDESAVRRAIDKVPGLRLLLPHQNRAGADFTPAKPLRLVQPDIPHELQSKIAGSTLDVRATIWKDGTLEPERVLTKNVTRELTNLTLYAIQESTFEPALIGKKPVSSRIVLHYRF
jgi:outer membrane biosynthesis protein TonB